MKPFILIVCLALCVSGCGVKGDLRLPEKEKQEKTDESR